jgi:hypothetical protein
MPGTKTISPSVEPAHAHHSHLLCWKSIFAGLLISIMAYMILSSLGVAIVGVAAQSAIENEQGGNLLASGAGIWMGLSAVAALFLGSYFTVRISKSVTYKVGAAHGFVVSSAFFIILTVLATSAVGSLSMGLGHLVSGLGQGAAEVGSNTRVQDTINQAMGTSANLKSDPKVVSEGIAVRLLQGDVQSAKSYYAYQSGLSEAEVSAKIDTLNANFVRIAKEVGDKAAEATAATGISLFVLFVLGVVSAMIAGRYAAHSNVERPLEAQENYTTTNHTAMFANQRGSAMPYIFGWLLGVPATILFLIFALRTIF